MHMKSRWVLVVLAVVIVAALTGCVNSKTVGSSNAGFMWVATQGDQMVSSFTINLSNGAASQVGKSVPSGAGPHAMAITPKEDALFLANVDDNCGSSQFCNQVRAYTVNSDGTLAPQGNPVAITLPSSMPLGMEMGMAVDPTGVLLFVTNQGNLSSVIPGTISIFKISGSSLSPANVICPASIVCSTQPTPLCPSCSFLTESAGAASSGPVALAISGPYLYVANQFDGTIAGYSYSIDSGGNVVIPTAAAFYAVNTNPSGLAFSRSVAVNPTSRDNFLFVANSGSNDISIFKACVAASLTCATPTGLLMPVGTAVGAGIGPNSFVVDPVADFVYAVDEKSNQISQYKYSPATGALTTLSPASASTGSNPISAGVTHDGNWVFVANNGASNLSAFQIGGAGKLNLPANPSIVLSNQPSVVLVK